LVNANLTPLEIDFYSFSATQGQPLKLSISQIAGNALSDVVIYRLDAGGDFTKLTSNPIYGNGSTAPLTFNSPSTGTFILRLKSAPTVSGAYTVLLGNP
jgi:hypothetical protein